jgi:hypothetical protein
MVKMDFDFIYVSTIEHFNKYLPQCNIETGRYLCFETFACVFLLRCLNGVPKNCDYYELPGGTQRDKLTTTRIVNHKTSILASEAEATVLERINRELAWIRI